MMNSRRARPTPSLGRKDRRKASSGFPTFIRMRVRGRASPERSTRSTSKASRPRVDAALLALGAGDRHLVAVRERLASRRPRRPPPARRARAPRSPRGRCGRRGSSRSPRPSSGSAPSRDPWCRRPGPRPAGRRPSRSSSRSGARGRRRSSRRRRARARAARPSRAGDRSRGSAPRAATRTVSGRACTTKSSPLIPSFAHSMSIGVGTPRAAL